MANTNAPFGLRYLGLSGSPPTNSALRERRNGILSTNTTAIYTGDLIMQSSDGYLMQWTATTPAYRLVGVFAGCRYASTSQQTTVPSKYYPGTDAITGSVLAQFYPASGPTPLFVIQTDVTGIVVADIGLNADITVGTGANGISGSFLTTTGMATNVTLPLRIVDLWVNWSMGNSPEGAGSSSALAPGTQAGAYNWAVVALNQVGIQGI